MKFIHLAWIYYHHQIKSWI